MHSGKGFARPPSCHDLPANSIPPNMQHLQHVCDGLIPIDLDNADIPISTFGFCDSPFSTGQDDSVRITCTDTLFGFQVNKHTKTGCAHVQDLVDDCSALTM
jgi:hypothetical protein